VCAAGAAGECVLVLLASSLSGVVAEKKVLMLALPLSLAFSVFFRGIVCKGTTEGKAQKILVSLQNVNFIFLVFFLKKNVRDSFFFQFECNLLT
jgi:hypothetical protein